MIKKRRIVIGSEIISKNDNECHYKNAYELCKLYDFNIDECYLVETRHIKGPITLKDIIYCNELFSYPRNLPIYMARYFGDYKHSKLKIWWQEFRYAHHKFLGTPKNAVFFKYGLYI